MICGPKPKLPPETVRRVREWARLGRNMTEVARAVGVSRQALREYINRTHKRVTA